MVFGLNEENPQLSWKTFTENIDTLTAPNPGDRQDVLAKNAPAVYWNSVPLEQLSAWLKAHLDEGMTQRLANNMQHAHLRLDEKNRLQQAADSITGARKQ